MINSYILDSIRFANSFLRYSCANRIGNADYIDRENARKSGQLSGQIWRLTPVTYAFGRKESRLSYAPDASLAAWGAR